MCALNAVEQAYHVCRTGIVRDAWARGHAVAVHAWVYGLHDGRLRDLGLYARNLDELDARYHAAIETALHPTSPPPTAA
jgi:carbonic anhydrase